MIDPREIKGVAMTSGCSMTQQRFAKDRYFLVTGVSADLPIPLKHAHGRTIGYVTAFEPTVEGRLRFTATVTDGAAWSEIQRGELRGVSCELDPIEVQKGDWIDVTKSRLGEVSLMPLGQQWNPRAIVTDVASPRGAGTLHGRSVKTKADVDEIGAALFGARAWAQHRADLDRAAAKRRQRALAAKQVA